VCESAASLVGITKKQLDQGYYRDPATKYSLGITARPSVVNGALAVIYESLDGNAIFTARLVSTGHMVSVHPTDERREVFPLLLHLCLNH